MNEWMMKITTWILIFEISVILQCYSFCFVCRWLCLHGLIDYSGGCERPAEQRSRQCQGPLVSRKQVCSCVKFLMYISFTHKHQYENVMCPLTVLVALASCWMLTALPSYWRDLGTLGYMCEGCLILVGSWTTSSTTVLTVWTLSAVLPLRP